MSGRSIPAIWGEGIGISRNWATAHFFTFMVSLGTVMVPVGVSLACWCVTVSVHWGEVQWVYTEAQGLVEVSSTILDLVGSNHLCHVLWLCHSFKGCALPPFLLFQCWASFHVPVGHLYISFGEMFIQVFYPFFDCVVCFFWYWVVWVFIYFRYQPFIRYMICKYFLPFSRLPFHFVNGVLCCAKAIFIKNRVFTEAGSISVLFTSISSMSSKYFCTYSRHP